MEPTKTCSWCGVTKPHSEFYPNYATPARAPINPCRKCRSARKRAQFTSTPEAFIRRTVSALSSTRKKQGVGWSLTPDEAISLYRSQDGLCALTGLPMTHQRAKNQINEYNISIDRIDSSGPYTKANVHLVCKKVNMARRLMSVPDFIIMCHQVANHTKDDDTPSAP